MDGEAVWARNASHDLLISAMRVKQVIDASDKVVDRNPEIKDQQRQPSFC